MISLINAGVVVFPNRYIGVEFEASMGNQGKRALHLHLFISVINAGVVLLVTTTLSFHLFISDRRVCDRSGDALTFLFQPGYRMRLFLPNKARIDKTQNEAAWRCIEEDIVFAAAMPRHKELHEMQNKQNENWTKTSRAK